MEAPARVAQQTLHQPTNQPTNQSTNQPTNQPTIGLGIAVGARGLARGRMGQDPPRQGWRMHDEIAAAIDGPINYAHLMSSEAFGAPN